uniref:Uncharacterized protein n=1 Tax=Opuntia streptacantha TaxID=393608 RepID=A0A7C9F1D7_OPUST
MPSSSPTIVAIVIVVESPIPSRGLPFLFVSVARHPRLAMQAPVPAVRAARSTTGRHRLRLVSPLSRARWLARVSSLGGLTVSGMVENREVEGQGDRAWRRNSGK